MRHMRKMLWVGTVVSVLAAIFSSCNLDDFDLDKLTEPTDLNPKIYAPLAYGAFKVGDFITLGLPDNDTIHAATLSLNPITHDINGTDFYSAVIDSVYLLIEMTNSTPMKMQLKFAFVDVSGVVQGKIYDSGIVQVGKSNANGTVAEPFVETKQFNLGKIDLDNLNASTGLVFWINFLQPDSGAVIVKNLKTSVFKTRISFYAPLRVSKLGD